MLLFLLILVLGFVLQMLLPWWVSGLVSFGLAWAFARKPGQAFAAGFAGIGLGWLGYSLFFYVRNDAILASKLAVLFHLPHAFFLLLLTLLIGGLVGGITALAGFYWQQAMVKAPISKIENAKK